MIHRTFVCVFLVATSFGVARAESNSKLVEQFSAAVVDWADSIDPIDVVAEYNSEETHDGSLQRKGYSRFRLYLSAKEHVLVWAHERSHGIEFGVFSPHLDSSRQKTFSDAVTAMGIPNPEHWGLLFCPDAMRGTTLNELVSGNSDLTVQEGQAIFLRFHRQARTSSNQRIKIAESWHWDLQGDQHFPTKLTARRKIGDSPERVLFEQSVAWDEVRGHQRPRAISGVSKFLKPQRNSGKLQRGELAYELGLHWLESTESSLMRLVESGFPTDLDARKFIDDGLDLAGRK
ncbi:MAG: hypothetical protein AAFX06_31615 [Planctomycetota bacterium]